MSSGLDQRAKDSSCKWKDVQNESKIYFSEDHLYEYYKKWEQEMF